MTTLYSITILDRDKLGDNILDVVLTPNPAAFLSDFLLKHLRNKHNDNGDVQDPNARYREVYSGFISWTDNEAATNGGPAFYAKLDNMIRVHVECHGIGVTVV